MEEIKKLRKSNEKHFLNKDGTITAYLYDKDIHYLKDKEYIDIDNTLVEENDVLVNKTNSFQTYFSKDPNDDKLLRIKKDKHDLSMSLNKNKKNKNFKLKRDKNNIDYIDILENIDLKYELISNKIKESIILNDRSTIKEKITFKINTDLNLELNEDKTISAKNKEDIIYIIDAPFMVDQNNNYNYNINYSLGKEEQGYSLTLNLDQEWLNNDSTIFPVIIDPTIIVDDKSKYQNIYIYSGDTSVNRNNDKLIVGADSNNRIHRSLIKFDLPTISTGDQVISAKAILSSHKSDYEKSNYEWYHILDVHNINTDWNETNANWNTMNNKFNERIEDCVPASRTYFDGGIVYFLKENEFNITNLVRKWYSDTPNYGFMIKAHIEKYDKSTPEHIFYSKNHNETSVNPKPFFIITYKNQNGLEEYMSYDEQNYTEGKSYINRFIGNLTTEFNLGQTLGKKFPVSLTVVYNTNDVILNNNYGYGIGYKFNLHQLITEEKIDGKDYIIYLDEDGTKHYFTEFNDEIIDLEGLGLTINKNNDNYIIKDKTSNQMIFEENIKVWYLKEIIDTKDNKVIINYDSLNRINSIIDADDNELNIIYETNRIIVQSRHQTTIEYLNNKIENIRTKLGYTYFKYYNDLLNEILDITGKKVKFEYYDAIPYKIKKVIEYGTDDIIGSYLEYTYGFDTTTIKDNKGFYNTYTFNKNGNQIGLTNLNGEENLKSGYGKTQFFLSDYLPKATNKIGVDRALIKYVKNYIYNSSFEEDDYSFFTINETTVTKSDENSRTGLYSIKIINDIEKEIKIPKNNFYTFSMYIKNNCNAILSFGYDNEFANISIPVNEDFERYYVSTNYPEDAISDLKIKIKAPGVLYIDDIQLETGEVANYHNLIDNSDFEDDFNKWELKVGDFNNISTPLVNDEIITLLDGQKALKINADPYKEKVLIKDIPVSGHAGDIYYLSFWYKNTGISTGYNGNFNNALIKFIYPDNEDGHGEYLSHEFNLNNTEWQFFEEGFGAEKDYESIQLIIFNLNNANELYLTDFMLFKDIGSNSFNYDEKGNLVSVIELNKEKKDFKYDKNNQLISMFNPKGSNFKFEYDNNISDRVLSGISTTRIANEIKYDEFDNPVKTIIKNVYFDKEQNKQICNIRYKGTNKYLKYNPKNKTIELNVNDCSYDKFIFEKAEDLYYIKTINNLNKYIRINNNNSITFEDEKEKGSLFEIKEIDNGSYIIKENKTINYLCIANNRISIKQIEEPSHEEVELEDDYEYNVPKELTFEEVDEIQFYIEKLESNYIETRSVYNEDGSLITKTIDALGNAVNYNIDQSSKLVKSITDPKGNEICYNYDTEDRLISIGNQTGPYLRYYYNEQNLLTRIERDPDSYSFEYDEFLNPKKIKINDTPLITNNYDTNKNNLVNTVYGNNHKINFNYDEMNRLEEKVTMDNKYINYYNNLGQLAKIKSENALYNYDYDFAKRLTKYRYKDKDNEFNIKYSYDKNNNIDNKKYMFNNDIKEFNYVYNNEETIEQIIFDNNNTNFIYDNFGRLKEKNINENNKVIYEYITNGKKTSLLIKSMQVGSNIYKYQYDELNNISHIYLDDKLIHKYYYDTLNELKKEDNYITNKTIIYSIGGGNIYSKKEYTLDSWELINEDKYEYKNNSWRDLLTKFNNKEITYDEIGNPISIGDNITLNWINGKQLNHIIQDGNNYQYKYNKDGIRISKNINDHETKYYLEGTKIIFEQTGNDVLYYIRDNDGDLIGFKYNNDIYYYIKNLQEDIIGIVDNDNNKIATYKYDSWGVIESILDNNGNDISNNQTHIANINPFKYRSYYYDNETKLYYLNSRYYNPRWKRFINADNIIGANPGILGYNLFTYVNNNPIMYSDNDGTSLKSFFKAVITAVKKVISVVVKVANLFVERVKEDFKLYKNTFVAEIGYGKGLDLKYAAAVTGKYSDKTIGIKNGEKFEDIISTKKADLFGFGGSIDTIENDLNSRLLPKIIPGISLPYTSISNENIFIGIDYNMHLFYGFHIKIGFEVDFKDYGIEINVDRRKI